jgi:GNAT superfamily N-acetyltransferase
VPGAPKASLRVEARGPHHDRSTFASGVEPPDRYLRSQAGQDARKNMAALLGRLAIDQNHQGRGYGRFLLADALFRAVRSEIASFAVIVDAKDEAARRFYERESFLSFPDQPMKLFRPMADIAKLFE